jgi:phage gpG-like protein
MAAVKLSLEQFRDRMGRMVPLVQKGVLGGMRAGLLLALKSSKNEYFLGGNGAVNAEKLTSRSGRLRDSVRVIEPYASPGGFTGGLRAGGAGIRYAAIHERGGVTRPHVIVPKKAGGWLSWVDKTGVRAFAKRVRHPGSRIPARPYLFPALEKSLPQISKQVSVAIEVAFAKGLAGG